jgi:hypothetical protein
MDVVLERSGVRGCMLLIELEEDDRDGGELGTVPLFTILSPKSTRTGERSVSRIG